MTRPNAKANPKELWPDRPAARVHFHSRLHDPRAQRRHPHLADRNGLTRSAPPLGAH